MSSTEIKHAQFKLVLLGGSAVGKSSIVQRFVKNSFDEFRESTIGAAFLTQSIEINEPENIIVKFEIWDTAGQERYRSLASMYYRNAQAAIIVYDITQTDSLEKAKYWIRELQKQTVSSNIIIALVGNKLDLKSERTVSYESANSLASELGLLYFEVSAKTGESVSELFESIAMKMPFDKYFNNSSIMNKNKNLIDLSHNNNDENPNCSC